MEVYRIHEIRAGIKSFFACSVYGSASGIALAAGFLRRFSTVAAKSRRQDFFMEEEFLNMNPPRRPHGRRSSDGTASTASNAQLHGTSPARGVKCRASGRDGSQNDSHSLARHVSVRRRTR